MKKKKYCIKITGTVKCIERVTLNKMENHNNYLVSKRQ